MEQDLASRLERCVTQIETLLSHRADHETRIRSLETRQWYAIGALGLLTFAVPLVMSLVK